MLPFRRHGRIAFHQHHHFPLPLRFHASLDFVSFRDHGSTYFRNDCTCIQSTTIYIYTFCPCLQSTTIYIYIYVSSLGRWVINYTYNSIMHISAGWIIELFYKRREEWCGAPLCVLSSEIAHHYPLTHATQPGHSGLCSEVWAILLSGFEDNTATSRFFRYPNFTSQFYPCQFLVKLCLFSRRGT